MNGTLREADLLATPTLTDTEPSVPQVMVKRSSPGSVVLASVVTLLLVLGAALLAWQQGWLVLPFLDRVRPSSLTAPEQLASPSPLVAAQDVEQVVRFNLLFPDDSLGKLRALLHDGTARDLTTTDVGPYVFHEASGHLAYIVGERKAYDSGTGFYLEPNAVVVRLSPFAEGEKAFTLQSSHPISELQDYSLQLRDIAWNADGSVLAITTSDGLYLWDAAAKTVKPVFTKPASYTQGRVAGDFVFAYRQPRFSPDGQHVLLTEGHYEGSANIIADVTSGTTLRLPYHSYTAGTTPIGWRNNQELFVLEYGFVHEFLSMELFAANFATPESRTVLSKSESMAMHYPLQLPAKPAVIIFIGRTAIATSDQPGEEGAENLYELDTRSGVITPLLPESGFAPCLGRTIRSKVSDNGESVWLQCHQGNNTQAVYRFDRGSQELVLVGSDMAL